MYINGTHIRTAMACTECSSYRVRTAVAYQPRTVGRYQSLPYALLCRFHVGAIKMHNARRAKENARREARGYTWGIEEMEEFLPITPDIIAAEDARVAAEVKAAEEEKAEKDRKAAAADREYTRVAKSRARAARKDYGERRFVGIEVVREEVAREYGNAAYIRYGIDATIVGDDPATKVDRVGVVTVSLPTYNTWDGGKFVPSRVQYHEGETAWLYSPDLIRGYVAQAMAQAMAEAASLNAGWLK